MKKIVFVIVIIVTVIGSGAAYYFLMAPKKGLQIEDILPPEVQLYAQFKNADKNMARLASTPFIQSLSTLNYDELIKNEIVDAGQAAVIKEILAKLNDPQLKTVLSQVFGREFVVAVYPLSVSVGNMTDFSALTTPTFLDDAVSNFMIVCRISPEMQAAEFFSRLLGDFGSETTKETLTYKDTPINSIIFNKIGLRISYAMVKDLMVVTLSERAVQKIIDVHLKERPALTSDLGFIKAKDRTVPDSDIYLYWDMVRFFSYITDQMKAMSGIMGETDEARKAQITEQINASLNAVKGFKSFVLSGKMEPLIELKLNMVMDVASLSPELSYLYTCAPTANKTLKFIPSGVLGYQWSSCLMLEQYWKQLVKEMSREPPNPNDAVPSPMEEVQKFENMIGLSVERDILPAIGDEFGGYLADIQIEGMFPIPKFLFFIEVKDKDKIDKLLSLLSQNPMIMQQQEEYGGTEIKYFSSPVGGDELQPGYAYLGDYLLIAINRKILKSSIDAQKAGSTSLVNDPAFQAIDKGLSDNNVNMYYIQLGPFAKKMENLLQWGNNWSDSQQKQREAMKAGSEQRLVIIKQDMKRLQGELDGLEQEIAAIDERLSTAGTMNAGADQEELEHKTEMASARKKDIEKFEAEMQDLDNLLQSYGNSASDAVKRELFLRDFVYPLLGGFSAVEAVGGRATISGDIYESTILMKVK